MSSDAVAGRRAPVERHKTVCLPSWCGRGSGPLSDPSPTTMSKIRCSYSYYIVYSSCNQTNGRTNVEAAGLIATAFICLNLFTYI